MRRCFSMISAQAMVNGILEAGYLNQGQICAAAERFICPVKTGYSHDAPQATVIGDRARVAFR